MRAGGKIVNSDTLVVLLQRRQDLVDSNALVTLGAAVLDVGRFLAFLHMFNDF